MTKREMLVNDLNEAIKYVEETIEESEFATDTMDNWHRGQLAAYKIVLRQLDLIDEQFETDARLNALLGIE